MTVGSFASMTAAVPAEDASAAPQDLFPLALK